ncbi:MAG TPA: aldehyde dehydrogenase family protein [Trueperaceae bacterium]|nr:aldehyde dehydrogenase family protein [Trueperaceae bacterium]
MEMLLADAWVERDAVIEVMDPDDERVIDTVPQATTDDMERALEAAERGAATARSMATHARMAVLYRAADRLEAEQEDFARLIAREGIKTIREARQEANRAADTLRLSAEEARRIHGETLAFDQRPGSERRFGYFVPEPVGIVAAITPFNDPLNLVVHKVGPALAAGNAVVLKPDSKTPLSALKLARLLLDSGLPPEVLQVVTGRGSVVGDALVRDARVRVVSFTGGRETGEAIVKAGGLKRYSMELGSNAPTIVMEDADLAAAIPAIVSGAFWAAGQNCLHVQRLLVQDGVYQAVRDGMVEGAERLKLGPKLDETTDMGPLIDAPNAERVASMVEEARTAGAHLLTGGGYEGTHFEPTLLEGVPSGTRLTRDEVYGPVTILERVRDLEEAVAIANDVDYGLQAAVFTRDLETAHRAVSALRYGGVMVNDSTDYRIDAMPFGGVKGSGLGREGVRFAVHEMTELKLASFQLG